MTGDDGPSKVSGNLKAAHGQVKESVGSMFGNNQMEAEGKAKHTEGNAEHNTAKAKGWTEGAGDSMLGGIKKQAGKLFGDNQMEAEGGVRETKGDAKKSANS